MEMKVILARKLKPWWTFLAVFYGLQFFVSWLGWDNVEVLILIFLFQNILNFSYALLFMFWTISNFRELQQFHLPRKKIFQSTLLAVLIVTVMGAVLSTLWSMIVGGGSLVLYPESMGYMENFLWNWVYILLHASCGVLMAFLFLKLPRGVAIVLGIFVFAIPFIGMFFLQIMPQSGGMAGVLTPVLDWLGGHFYWANILVFGIVSAINLVISKIFCQRVGVIG